MLDILAYAARHWLYSTDEHSLHSPFLFDLHQALKANNATPRQQEFEVIRKKLLKEHTAIVLKDYGAGSRVLKTNTRKISSIASSSLSSAVWCRRLAALVEKMQAKSIIELGTSLGIMSLYLANAAPTGQLYSFEGDTQIASIAKRNFETANQINIHLIEGNIDQTLPDFIAHHPPADFYLMDANHTYKATMRYFDLIIKCASANAIIVLDDIHWSKGMHQAWNQIKSHPKVHLSIDAYKVGILFLDAPFDQHQEIWRW
jgi:predicted O-methyltransferase YrrM